MAVRRSAQRIPALRLNDRELRLGTGHEACNLLQMAKQLPQFNVRPNRRTHWLRSHSAFPGEQKRVLLLAQPVPPSCKCRSSFWVIPYRLSNGSEICFPRSSTLAGRKWEIKGMQAGKDAHPRPFLVAGSGGLCAFPRARSIRRAYRLTWV